MPVRKGDGTELSFKGFSEIRKGDGTVLWSKGSAIPDSGLLHRWNVSDQSYPITDSEASNDIGQVVGGSFITGSQYYDGVAFQTDGSDDVAEGASASTPSSFTMVWYMNPTLTSTTTHFYNNGNHANTERWPALYANDNDLLAQIADGTAGAVATDSSPSISSITQIAVRYDGSTLSIVRDLTETATATETLNPPSNSDPITIGAKSDGAGGYDTYSASEFDFGLHYNRHLSISELSDINDAHPSI